MSRRFGRNQKRAMRERIAQAEQAATLAQEEHDREAKKLWRAAQDSQNRAFLAENQLDKILRVFSRGSVFLEPMRAQGAPDSLREIVPFQFVPMERAQFDARPDIALSFIHHRLCNLTPTARQALDGMIHVRFEHPKTGELLGYSISEGARERMTLEIFREYIWPNVAENIRHAIEKAFAHG